jgi:SOS-response transcriptional repressor LexA
MKDGRFEAVFKLHDGHRENFELMVQEIIDYRLATYEIRRIQTDLTNNVIPFFRSEKANNLTALPYFPNLKVACGHFKTGTVDAEEYRNLPTNYGNIDPNRHFIARASGNSMNGGKHPIQDGDYLLLEHITPTNAGSITGSVMAIERQDESGDGFQYLLRHIVKTPDGGYVLRATNKDYQDMDATEDMHTLARFKAIFSPLDLAVGQAFKREDIAPLFGETYSIGNWNVGHVTLASKNTMVLLVTLNKQGKAADHRYVDHWVDDSTFHWQSQNSTTPNNKRGRDIIEHEQKGLTIHLFVRESKLYNGKGASFVYHGAVRYVSHTGSSPMSVIFSLATL